ncbi:protein-L-isoaspartate(D-aspartate) O-methyltransferase [Croceicoccus hydrothermalis]|uniref:protein-L-isoaspartate(D-aspartate) O-methyltransferase n=1 Tax=Croceicoccus hydrothermalis TaxID=2867964 RepID=UPI001EFC1F8C|nr:protein-L-isoaspartate(D-aspartate) O-methyltransferase [Croceicoccus hydrothermalis]
MTDDAHYSADRAAMVTRQIEARGIDDPAILKAFRAVPRERFVSDDLKQSAYNDEPLPIGEDQTISQPYIVACVIEAAGLSPGATVLEVGAGSGYAVAVMSRIARQVYGIERHEPLANDAKDRIDTLGYGNCTIVLGDGQDGLPEHAPFDAIIVSARTGDVPPALKRQLAIGGKLVIPIGDEDMQQLRCIERTGPEDWKSHDITPVRFVPLLPGVMAQDGSPAATEHRATSKRTLSEMVAEAAIRLPPIEDETFARAFDRFADKRIVMLGESSHGTHEFYAARAAITKRLVEHHGFTIVAVEGDWPDAAVYDRYIRGKEADRDAAPPFRRFPTWMWRNTVLPGFLTDLREYNAVRSEHEQAGFYGLDIYNMSGSIDAILAYLDEHDSKAAAMARERYGCLTPWQSDPAAYGHVAMQEGFAECEDAVVAQCRALLKTAIEHDRGSFSAAMNARLVASAERYYRVMYHGGAESWNLRDGHMTDTLAHLLDRGGPDAKAVVWAHNSHIGDARATDMGAVRGEHNLGQLARERWGEDAVALIGFGTHGGTVSAADEWGGDRKVKRINPSRRDSYERVCHDSGALRFLLDLSGDARLRDRLSEPRLERFIGVIYRPETERWSHYSEAILPRQFDAWCWFDETRALQPLKEHEPYRTTAETFPFGV